MIDQIVSWIVFGVCMSWMLVHAASYLRYWIAS